MIKPAKRTAPGARGAGGQDSRRLRELPIQRGRSKSRQCVVGLKRIGGGGVLPIEAGIDQLGLGHALEPTAASGLRASAGAQYER